MLKFLIDESAGKKLYKFLLEKEFDTKFVTDAISRATDKEVLELAEKEGRILITNDKDFGELIFRSRKPSSGVILLRLKIDLPQKRQEYTLNLIETLSERLKLSFVVVTEGKVRVRKL